MSQKISRGALIILEGCDCCGKTTQGKKLVEALNAEGIKAKFLAFPDRTTTIGQIVSKYLKKKCDLEDHAIHLLFTANRWEAVPEMTKLLQNGTTLIIDRYSYSGVAFSAAKQGLDIDWCKQPDIGLPKPDAVFYLMLNTEEASKRGVFGNERYEQTEFQLKVSLNFDCLKEKDWIVIDANKSIDSLHIEIKVLAKEIIHNIHKNTIGQLWVDDDYDHDLSSRVDYKPIG